MNLWKNVIIKERKKSLRGAQKIAKDNKKWYVSRMVTAKELKKKYDRDLKKLQETCKHENISDWLVETDSHGDDTGVRIKQCKICWKLLLYKATCEACSKEFTYEFSKRDWSTSQLCPECLKKGRYYCWQHKLIHNDLQGCPKCLKQFGHTLFEEAPKYSILKWFKQKKG